MPRNNYETTKKRKTKRSKQSTILITIIVKNNQRRDRKMGARTKKHWQKEKIRKKKGNSINSDEREQRTKRERKL